MNIELGLAQLHKRTEQRSPNLRAELATLEARWLANSESTRIMGESENTRRELAQIIHALNGFALQHFNLVFNELCRDQVLQTQTSSATAPSITTTQLTDVFPTAYSHHLDSSKFPFLKITIDNTGQGCANLTIRASAWIERYSDPAVVTRSIPLGQLVQVALLPILKDDAIRTLNDIRQVTLHTKVEQVAPEEQLLDEHTTRIHLQARDTALLAVQAHDHSIIDLSDYLAAFVTPRRIEIEQLLRQAAERHPQKQFVGYQGSSSDIVREQVRAIFNSLKHDANITYVNSPLTLGIQARQISQRVRLPTESLTAGGSANCIDGTVLFASLLELASLQPLMIIVPGHAFVGWRVMRNQDRYEFIETTLIGSAEFESAQQAAQARYDKLVQRGDLGRGLFEPSGFARIIDVAQCRSRGVYPLE